VLTGVLILVFLLRNPILKSFAHFLIVEDEIEYVEYAFVLSGQALERGIQAAELLNSNKVGKIFCTVANQPPDLAVYESDLLESDLTKIQILKDIEDSSKVELLQIGTSTFEEAQAILDFCQKKEINEVLIITSKFHTRRVKRVFHKQFKNQGIKLYFSGAKSKTFDETWWWKNEYGLISLNNEYLKLIYYLVKY
jgi:uncharacterized SAM-binding protein YcdF (DUF218 family)